MLWRLNHLAPIPIIKEGVSHLKNNKYYSNIYILNDISSFSLPAIQRRAFR